MKRLFNIFSIFCIVAAALCLSACSNDDHDLQVPEQNGEWIAVPLQFNPAADSRAAFDYENGDMLLLSLSAGSENVYGYATYSKDTYSWTAYLQSEPTPCTDRKCSVVYINNNPTMNNDEGFVALTPHNATMKGDGTFSYSDKGLIVDCKVTPDTARIRFKGSNQTGYQFRGVIAKDRYEFVEEGVVERYDFENEQSYSNYSIDFTEQDGEYLSDYYYVEIGYFCKYLHMRNGNTTYLLTKSLFDYLIYDYLKDGSSITITMPEEDNPGSWVSDTYREINPALSYISTKYGSYTSNEYYLDSTSGATTTINFVISYCNPSEVTGWYPFHIWIVAYDENGTVLEKRGTGIQTSDFEDPSDTILGEQLSITIDNFNEDATRYGVYIECDHVYVSISSFTISNY